MTDLLPDLWHWLTMDPIGNIVGMAVFFAFLAVAFVKFMRRLYDDV